MHDRRIYALRLDGYGLRDSLPARPTLTPHIRFLFIGPHLCSTLPSDPASRRQPLRFTNPSPPSGWVEDFHLRAIEHARHTTERLRRGERRHRLRVAGEAIVCVATGWSRLR